MKSKEELIGAEVLALVDGFHSVAHHRHHPKGSRLKSAVEALALLSLAHHLAPRRSRRLTLATVAYLQRKGHNHHHHHHHHHHGRH